MCFSDGLQDMLGKVDNSGAVKEPARGVSLLEQVTPLARQVNCLEIDSIAQVCVRQIPSLICARFASLYVLDEANAILHLHGSNHPFAINKIVSLNHRPAGLMVMAARSREFIIVKDIDTHASPVIKRSQRPFAGNYSTGNCIVAPLVCQDKVVGVFNIADKQAVEGFNCEDVALVELFSQLVGASIGNIKLFEKIQHQATTDSLTGLVNHKTFYETLEKELWRSRRYGGQISLIMIDIDNLKTINDTFGHRAGDRVIKTISRQINECIRQIDTAARYGGDEFAVILPNTSLADTIFVAERMVEATAQTPVYWEKQPISLSISVGVGQYDANSSPEDMTNRSDQALYTAKKAGKNTVRIYQPVAG